MENIYCKQCSHPFIDKDEELDAVKLGVSRWDMVRLMELVQRNNWLHKEMQKNDSRLINAIQKMEEKGWNVPGKDVKKNL